MRCPQRRVLKSPKPRLRWLLLTLTMAACMPLMATPKGEKQPNTAHEAPQKVYKAPKELVKKLIEAAHLHEQSIQEYKADLYMKGVAEIQKKNILFRHIPGMFRPKKGVNKYITESYSYLHYKAPNRYDRKVKGTYGTIPYGKNVPEVMEYRHINIYSATLIRDERLLSPLGMEAETHYKYYIEAVDDKEKAGVIRIQFKPRKLSDQLVSGNMWVDTANMQVREMRFDGQYSLIRFQCRLEMGQPNSKEALMPVKQWFDAYFSFAGNKVKANYFYNLKYKDISVKLTTANEQKKKKYDLTEYYFLEADTNGYKTTASAFAAMRPIPLSKDEQLIYEKEQQKHSNIPPKSCSNLPGYWRSMRSSLFDYQDFSSPEFGHLRFRPFISPLLLSYTKSNGPAYKQRLKYLKHFNGDRDLYITPLLGYNFKRKEFYWSVPVDYYYAPRKRGYFRVNAGNGNRIYSSRVAEELQQIHDSIFDFNKMQLDLFHDLHLDLWHSIEPLNGLVIGTGVSMHRRTSIESGKHLNNGKAALESPPLLSKNIRDRYISFSPRIRVEWTPKQYYYMNGKRKINLYSKFPTLSVDYERGLQGIFHSTGQYERIEFDVQSRLPLGFLRLLYYRCGMGFFTNREELFFVDFVNFTRHNLPTGWDDEIGGVFHLLDSRYYNAGFKYFRAHLTYESPFILMPRNFSWTRYLQNERFYLGVLSMNHLRTYIELGYGFSTYIFDVGAFVSNVNGKFSNVGFKFTFELFKD